MAHTPRHGLKFGVVAGQAGGASPRPGYHVRQVILAHAGPEGRAPRLGRARGQGHARRPVEQATAGVRRLDQASLEIDLRRTGDSRRRRHRGAQQDHGAETARLLESTNHGLTIGAPALRFGFRLRLRLC